MPGCPIASQAVQMLQEPPAVALRLVWKRVWKGFWIAEAGCPGHALCAASQPEAAGRSHIPRQGCGHRMTFGAHWMCP